MHRDLKCRVHLKYNQALKYLSLESYHPIKFFKYIPNGILKRLSKSTSASNTTSNSRMDTLYPGAAKSLRTAKKIPIYS